MIDQFWIQHPLRTVIGSFFTVIISFSANIPWFQFLVLSFFSFVTEILLSSTFLSFLASFISFLVARKLESHYDFTSYLRGIRDGLDDDLLLMLSYFPLIWSVASHFFFTSTFFAFLASIIWFLFARYLFTERRLSYSPFIDITSAEVGYSIIATVAYFFICLKVYNSCFSLANQNALISCPAGILESDSIRKYL